MIIRDKTSLEQFGEFVKVVVDIEKKSISATCEMHVDCLDELIKEGSRWENCWGANVYPKTGEIQFDSMINVKPTANASIEIQDQAIREKVLQIIRDLVL